MRRIHPEIAIIPAALASLGFDKAVPLHVQIPEPATPPSVIMQVPSVEDRLFQKLTADLVAAEKQYGFLSIVFKDRKGKGIVQTEEGGRPRLIPIVVDGYQTFPSRVIDQEIAWEHEVRIRQGNIARVYAVLTLHFFPESPHYDTNVFYLIDEIGIDPQTGIQQRTKHIQRASEDI